MDLMLFPIGAAEKMNMLLFEKHFPKRVKKALSLSKEEDRLRSFSAGVLLHMVLGVKEEDLSFNERGKPFLLDKSLFFSLSHSGEYSAIAVDNGEVGTDIEKITFPRPSVAKKCFTPPEQEWMEKDLQKRFFVLWTLKESVSKFLGKGLSLDMSSFCVLPLTEGKSIFLEGKEIFGNYAFFEDYCISVCGAHPTKSITPKVILKNDII